MLHVYFCLILLTSYKYLKFFNRFFQYFWSLMKHFGTNREIFLFTLHISIHLKYSHVFAGQGWCIFIYILFFIFPIPCLILCKSWRVLRGLSTALTPCYKMLVPPQLPNRCICKCEHPRWRHSLDLQDFQKTMTSISTSVRFKLIWNFYLIHLWRQHGDDNHGYNDNNNVKAQWAIVWSGFGSTVCIFFFFPIHPNLLFLQTLYITRIWILRLNSLQNEDTSANMTYAFISVTCRMWSYQLFLSLLFTVVLACLGILIKPSHKLPAENSIQWSLILFFCFLMNFIKGRHGLSFPLMCLQFPAYF